MEIGFGVDSADQDSSDIIGFAEDVFSLMENACATLDDVPVAECQQAPNEFVMQCIQAIFDRNPQNAIALFRQVPMLFFDARVIYAMYTNLSVTHTMCSDLLSLLPTYLHLDQRSLDHDTLMDIAQQLIMHPKKAKAVKLACQAISGTSDYSGGLEQSIIDDEDIFVYSQVTLQCLGYYLLNVAHKQEHFFYALPFNLFMPIFFRDVLQPELNGLKLASDYLYPRQMDAFYQIRNKFRDAHSQQKQISYAQYDRLSGAVQNFVDFGLNPDLRLLNHVNVVEAPTGYGKTRTSMIAALADWVDPNAYDMPQRNMIVGTRTRSQVRAFLVESKALGLSALGVPSKSLLCSLRSRAIIPENPLWSALVRLSKDDADNEAKALINLPASHNAKIRDELIEIFAGSDICKTCVFNPTNRKGFEPKDFKPQQVLEQALKTETLPGGLRIEVSQEDVDLMLEWHDRRQHHLVLSHLQTLYLDLDTAAEAYLIIFGRCGYRVAITNLARFRVLILTYPYLFDPKISRYFRSWCQTNRVVTSHAVIVDEAHGLDKIATTEPALNPNLLAKCFYYNEWMFHVHSLLGHAKSPLQGLFEFRYNAQEVADIISQTALGYFQVLRYLEDTQHDVEKAPIPGVRRFFPETERIHKLLTRLVENLESLAVELRNMSTQTKAALHQNACKTVSDIAFRITDFLSHHTQDGDLTLETLKASADDLIHCCYPSGFAAYEHRNFTSVKELLSFLMDLNDSLRNDMIKSEKYKDLSLSDIKMLSFTFHKISGVFSSFLLFYQYLVSAEGQPDNWIILVAEQDDWSFKTPFGKKLTKHLKRVAYVGDQRYAYHELKSPSYDGAFRLSTQRYLPSDVVKMLDNPEKVGKLEDKDRYDWTYVPYRLHYPKAVTTFLQHDVKPWKKMTGLRMELISNAAVLNSGFLGYNAIYMLSGTMPTNSYLRHFMGLHSHRTSVAKPLGVMNFTVGKGVTTKYQERDKHYGRYAAAILDIFCQRRLARLDRHVLVVFSSGKMLLEIYQRCFDTMAARGITCQELITEKDYFYAQEQRLLEHGVAPKYGEHLPMTIRFFTDYLRQHRAQSNPILAFVVAGGRYTEGIEYTYEGRTMLGTAICVGPPIPPPTPKMTALTQVLQAQGLTQWEIFEMMSLQSAFQRIRQAIGRTNRDDRDESEIFLLDDRYANQSYWLRKFPAGKVIDVQ